jgi:hypothetical protein
MTVYTHIVMHRIMGENGKVTDQLDYCIDINHAYAVAQQLMAVGAQGVAIAEFKQPITDPVPATTEE